MNKEQEYLYKNHILEYDVKYIKVTAEAYRVFIKHGHKGFISKVNRKNNNPSKLITINKGDFIIKRNWGGMAWHVAVETYHLYESVAKELYYIQHN